MTLHHPIALPQRFTVVERCLSLLRVVHHHHLQILQGHIFLRSSLHHTDAPVDISRITVLGVVHRGNGKIRSCIERLMTHQHALTERFPRQLFRWTQTTVVQKMPLPVDDVRIAIKHGRFLTMGTVPVVRNGLSDAGDGIGGREEIACVQEAHIVAIETAQALVHRVIDTLIRL